LACPGVDACCFCGAVGLGPDSAKGSDVLLVPVEGGYLAQAVTAKGEALLNREPPQQPVDAEWLDKAKAYSKLTRESVAHNLRSVPPAMPEWLATHFGDNLWSSIALRCHGCGACASICPTCHCFDIVDEHESYKEGVRRRNWDSCQTAKFTMHASNYNPRKTQTERFRQRVMHKFSVYPRRFGALLCTGCGRCARACPAGMNLPEVLGQLIQLAGAEPEGGNQ
jgi:ferredoxin